MFDHHDGGIWHIDADFDHRGRHQQAGFAVLEGEHGGVLLRAAHTPVNEADVGAEHLRENGVALLRRHQVGLLRLLHQRANPVGFFAILQRCAQPLDNIADAFGGDRHRLDGFAARRFFGELGDIHVPEGGQYQRAWNGRGGHDKHMRRDALGGEPQALMHAETVLFIHHGQHKVLIGDAVLEQRMGADDDLRFARGHALLDLAALLALGAAGQHFHREAHGLREFGDGGVMLTGENFGRRHQHRLSAGLHRRRHGHQRHQRLAGADIALQQPQHAVFAGHIGQDILDGGALACRQREGQLREDFGGDIALGADWLARHLAQPLAHQRQ